MPTPTPTQPPTKGSGSWDVLAVGPHGSNYLGVGPAGLLSTGGQGLALWVNSQVQLRASVYDPADDTWSRTAAPPCSCLLVALPDGTQFAIDSERTNGQPNTLSYIRGGLNQAWQQTAQLPDSRDDTVPVGLPGGQVLVLGGSVSPGAGSTATDFYDPTTDSWTAGPPLPFDDATAAVVLADGAVVVLSSAGKSARLKTGANHWVSAGKAPVGVYAEIVPFGNGAIALGGESGKIIYFFDPRTAIYNEATNAWSALPPMPSFHGVSPGVGAAAVQLPDGRLLVFGGSPGGSEYSATRGLAVLAADGSSWTSLASAPADLFNSVGWVMPDGSIVFAGEASDLESDVQPYLGAFRFTP